VRVVVWLAWARIRHRSARWLLIALGVAAATVLPVSAQSSATVVAAQALRHGLEALPVGYRSLSATRFGLRETPERIAELDRVARGSLAELAAGGVRLQMLTRSISNGVGGAFYFAATDGLPGLVRLTDGRQPTSCAPRRCEVVMVGAGEAPRLDPAFGIVIVGRAVRTDALLLTGPFDPGDGAPLLIADGVAAAAQLDYLSAFQRSYAWVTPVDLDRVVALGVDGYLARSAQASIQLYGARLSLTAPDEVLKAEAARAQGSARRFALLSGAATALLLGFAAIGAIGLRRDHRETVGLLRRRGAGRAQVAALLFVTAGVPVLVGAVLGAIAGGVLAAMAASRAGLAPWTASVHALGQAAPVIGVGAVAAALVVAVTVGVTGAERSAWRTVDLTVAVGVLVGALALARGAITAESVAGGTDALLLALPIIVVICGGLLVGRVWPVLTVAASRLFPRRMLAPRLGLLGAVRSPLRPVATAAFLAAATGIVTFAGAYQATLRQGAADQASFAVPLDARVQVGQSLRVPLEVASTKDYAAAGATIYPVLRTPGTIAVNAAQVLTPEVIGVDPAALALVHSWDQVVGTSTPDQASALLAGDRATPVTGVPVPRGATSLVFPATGNVEDLDISVWVRLADGRDVGVPLVHTAGNLVADLPAPAPAGAVLFAVTLSEGEFALTRRLHRTGEGHNDAAVLTGQISLLAPAANGWVGWGSDDATVAVAADRLTIAYQLTGARVVVRAGHATTPPALPVLVDAATAAAAPGGALALSLGSGSAVPARIVGVLPRFPTARASFVVTNVRLLADALDARAPGTGSVVELWLAATSPGLANALSVAPFDLLRVDLRQARADSLAADPLARGATDLLTGSALVALLVAVVALVLLVVAERRDSSAQMYAWESDGIAPATLRWTLFLHAVAVVVVAVPGGVLLGVVLSRITTALVRVTAVGTDPVPPLAVAISPLWTAVAVGGGIVAGLIACAALAATSMRERLPRRPEEGLS
jgi:hypothetical protein